MTGAEVSVHLKGNCVIAVSSNALTDIKDIDVVPAISDIEALVSCQELFKKHLEISDATFSKPRLEIFNQGILEGRPTPTKLAWFVESTGGDRNEYMWVDAHKGCVLLHFNQTPAALTRSIYNANHSPNLPGSLIRSEGGPATGDIDADKAYDYAGLWYNYFHSQHGRDSYDGAGARLILTVHYCDSTSDCPMYNAYWVPSLKQMVFGDGYMSPDVACHELTHAVTSYTANLFSYYQSGAINESISDIFGETIEFVNGINDTPPLRWKHGEDLPHGWNRDMMNPNNYNPVNGSTPSPAKMSDPYYLCGNNDSGGVHHNSGILNHAYALMVDGGTYNGKTISGIGLTKAGKIMYRTLVNYLHSASNFKDAYNAINQSATDLIGTAGITAADGVEVKKALDAVELSSPPPCSLPTPIPALCPEGQTASSTGLFFDDFESNGQNMLAKWERGGSPSSGWEASSDFPNSGWLSLHGMDLDHVNDAYAAMKDGVTIPANARMQFNHYWDFEYNVQPNGSYGYFDGGVVEYSTDGGTTWNDGRSIPDPLIREPAGSIDEAAREENPAMA